MTARTEEPCGLLGQCACHCTIWEPACQQLPQLSQLSSEPTVACLGSEAKEPSQITQSLASQTLNSSHSWNVEGSSWPSAWRIFTQDHTLPSCLDCYLHTTLMAQWEVPVWCCVVSTSPKCVHRKNSHYGLVPGAQWGSPSPRFSPRFHMTPDGEGPCREGLNHVWGLQGEWGLEPTRRLER